MNTSEFQRYLALASVPLRCIGEGQLPTAIGSSCIVDYGGFRWVLTVAHVVNDNGKWCIETGYEEGKGARLYCIGQLNYVDSIDPESGERKTLDLAFARIPTDLVARYQPRNEQANIVEDVPRIVVKPPLDSPPHPEMIYGFCGNVKPTKENHFGIQYIGTKTVCYPELKYVGDHDEFYSDFRFPFSRSDEFLEGTSGAPIADNEGRVVALVCCSGDKPDTIRGIKMSYIKTCLDAEMQSDPG